MHRILRSQTEACSIFLEHRSTVYSITFSPNSRSLLSSSLDGVFHSWDISQFTSTSALTTMPEGWRQQGAFSSDDKIITVVSGGQFRRLNAKTGEIMFQYDFDHLSKDPSFRHFDALRSDGERVAVGYQSDNSLCVYDTNSNELIIGPLQVHMKPDESMSCLAYSPRGSFLATGGNEGGINLWNAINGEEMFAIYNEGAGYINRIVFSPDEEWLISECYDSMCIHVWDTHTGVVLHSFDVARIPALVQWGPIDISPDGRYVAFGTRPTNSWSKNLPVLFIDLETNESCKIPPLLGHEREVTCVAFSPDGTMVAAGSLDSTILVWRVATPFGEHSLWGKGDDSGWILGGNNELLAWVPPELREGFNWTPQVRGDAHGTSWTQCLVEE